jgi:hypothetical protein
VILISMKPDPHKQERSRRYQRRGDAAATEAAAVAAERRQRRQAQRQAQPHRTLPHAGAVTASDDEDEGDSDEDDDVGAAAEGDAAGRPRGTYAPRAIVSNRHRYRGLDDGAGMHVRPACAPALCR